MSSACEKFRQFVTEAAEKYGPCCEAAIGDITWQFDALHQSSRENTGDKCSKKDILEEISSARVANLELRLAQAEALIKADDKAAACWEMINVYRRLFFCGKCSMVEGYTKPGVSAGLCKEHVLALTEGVEDK